MGDSTTWHDHFDESERAVLALADAMAGDRSHELDPALIDELQRHFDELQLAELILVAGQANLNNRAGNAAKQLLGPDPSADRSTRARPAAEQ